MIFQSHTVYIDKITVGDAMPTMAKPSVAPSGLAAKGCDRHIDLTSAPVQDSPLIGWNETMIIYLLAIASPTHAVPASLYHTGWASRSDTAMRYR
jgi:hypothetical protein